MVNLIQRHLSLFFERKASVFFSLLGALIAFSLYLIFLKPKTPITAWQLQLSYIFSATLVGWSMQLAVAGCMFLGFHLRDGLAIPWSQLPAVVLVSGFSSLLWTSFSHVCLLFVRTNDTLNNLASIISTAAGFFAGVYVPIGSLPAIAQTVMKLTPAPYDAALYRKILLHSQLQQSVANPKIEQMLGIRFTRNTPTTTLQLAFILSGFILLFLLLTLLLGNHDRQNALVRS